MKKKGKKTTVINNNNPEWTKADLKKARPLKDVDPTLYEMLAKRRGRPSIKFPKRQLTMRLSPKVIDGLKASGPGYNERVDRILQEALENGQL